MNSYKNYFKQEKFAIPKIRHFENPSKTQSKISKLRLKKRF